MFLSYKHLAPTGPNVHVAAESTMNNAWQTYLASSFGNHFELYGLIFY
jgi:hypothetical protein